MELLTFLLLKYSEGGETLGTPSPHLGVFSKTNSDAHAFTKEIPAQALVKLTFKGSECELSVSHFHPNPALSVFPTFPEFRD